MPHKLSKITLLLALLIIFSQSAISEEVLGVARTERLIQEEHKATRLWCEEQWNSKEQAIRDEYAQAKDELFNEVKTVLWYDRILSFFSLLLAAFLGFSVRSLLDASHKRRLMRIDEQEKATNREDLPEPPKPEYKPKGGVSNEQEFVY